jgi:hypothetical protein
MKTPAWWKAMAIAWVLLQAGPTFLFADEFTPDDLSRQGDWRLVEIQRMLDGGSWAYSFTLPSGAGVAIISRDGIENTFPPRLIEIYRTNGEKRRLVTTRMEIVAHSALETAVLKKLAESIAAEGKGSHAAERMADLIWLFQNRNVRRPHWKFNGLAERFSE